VLDDLSLYLFPYEEIVETGDTVTQTLQSLAGVDVVLEKA